MKKYQIIMCLIWVAYVFGAPPTLIKLKPHMDLEEWRLLAFACTAIYGSVTVVSGLVMIGLHAQIWSKNK